MEPLDQGDWGSGVFLHVRALGVPFASLTERGRQSGDHLPGEDGPTEASFPVWIFLNSCFRW